MKYSKFYLFIIFLIAVILDIFLFEISADIRIFTLIGLYLILIKIFKYTSKTTFFVALLLLCMSYTQFLLTDQKVFDNPGPIPPRAERTAVWLYIFMVIGVVQRWRE